MLVEASVLTVSVSQTGGTFSARISASRSRAVSIDGRKQTRPSSATAPMPATIRNVVRQPAAWAMKVPRGTPTTLAMVSPLIMRAIAPALRSVQRIWETHRLQPHRLRTFKKSNDPAFAEKVEDVVGLYMSPPAHAIVVSIDEKSQIQALDRTQPGLPLKPGKCATMTHDYKRNGTTTLLAALNVLDGTVLGRCMPRHRHQEFIRFLNAVEKAVPAGKVVHAILDNYATHKHPKVLEWLADHPRWTFHFMPTSASWLNAVENFFRHHPSGNSARCVQIRARPAKDNS